MRWTTRAPSALPGIIPLVLANLLASLWERYHSVARFKIHPLTHRDFTLSVNYKAMFATLTESYQAQFHQLTTSKTSFSTTFKTEVQP
jgi:hypothetical protein